MTEPTAERPDFDRHNADRNSDVIDNLIDDDRQPPRRSRVVAWATLGAVGVAAAVGGVVATHSGGTATPTTNTALGQAEAATSPSPSPSRNTNDKGGRRGPGGPGPGGWGHFGGQAGAGPGSGPGAMGRLGLGGNVLHGEATVKTPKGGTEVVDTQSGTISAVDTAKKTITVTSTDKVAFSYVVTSTTRLVDFAAASPMKATLADLKVGDTVRVMATRTGDTRTATSVLDGMPTPKKHAMGSATPNANA